MNLEITERRKQEHVNIGVIVGRLVDLPEHYLPFRVVGGSAARQHELTGIATLDQSVGLNHADGIFEPVKARNLGNDRSFGVESVLLEYRRDLTARDLAVLVAQGGRLKGAP